MPIALSAAEFGRRREMLLTALEKRGIDGLCLFSSTQVFYLTGFAFLATERPIAAILDAHRESVSLFVPLLEREHGADAHADEVLTYPEYPGDIHPMTRLAEHLKTRGLASGRLGADGDGYGGGYGYVGPRLSEVLDAEVIVVRELIERAMWVKSEEEIALIRESCRWGDRAHRLLQAYSTPGAMETEVALRASQEASAEMAATLGASYRPVGGGSLPAHAGFRGQIGAGSAVPHAMTANLVMRAGDVLVTGAGSDVGGYGSELERTMILGEPTAEQRRLFERMLAVQQLAIDAIQPGVRCSEIDQAVLAFYESHDLMDSWRHHTGHGIGYGMHESPFLDSGDHTVIEPGMVLTVEPGIYVPGVAGFRHSDTVLVTDTGHELLTTYPRDLEALTIAV
jgi:Xaa-Pro aminopeptidase